MKYRNSHSRRRGHDGGGEGRRGEGEVKEKGTFGTNRRDQDPVCSGCPSTMARHMLEFEYSLPKVTIQLLTQRDSINNWPVL